MSLDLERERWRQEWSFDTEPLPELTRRVRGQNRRLLAGGIALAACLAAATVVALRAPGSEWSGFAIGVWAAAVVGGGYALWVRRGTWEPAAQTTHAYADLLHRRAIATLAKTVFLRRALTVVLLAYGALMVWNVPRLTPRTMAVAALLALETMLFRAIEARRRRALDAAARLAGRASDTPGL